MRESTDTLSQAKIIDGAETAKLLKEELAKKIKSLVDKGRRQPGLAVILIGKDPASQIYVKNKVLACNKVGITSQLHELPEDVQTKEVLALIEKLNKANDVDGILVQLPLPGNLPTEDILHAVSSDKDVDGLHEHNKGLLLAGKPGLRPCTPLGIMHLLKQYGVEISGKRAVVIGRSALVGKPIALMLLEENATVTICHSRSKDLASVVKEADIIIAAAGKPELVKGSWVKPGAVVVDVGIHRISQGAGESKIVGDVDFLEVSQIASFMTPVPGGVGPMTVAMLLANTVNAYESKQQ